MPEEKKAIEQRGTDSVEAYNLYLMARQNYVVGSEGDARAAEAIVRLCTRATEIDPNYSRAWALMALGQWILRFTHGKGDDGLLAAERALAVDADLAEAHAVKARILSDTGRDDEAAAELARALQLDPESYEVNKSAARLTFRQHRIQDAIQYFEKATSLMETDINSPTMLTTCYFAGGDLENARRVAQIALARAQKTLAQDQNNGGVLAYGGNALAVLGEVERAKEWISRAMLVDPDNMNMRYNFACVLARHLGDVDAALEMLGPVFAKWDSGFLKHAEADPDLDRLRDDSRFQAMITAAEARIASGAEKK
jgi:adenylate cyclase